MTTDRETLNKLFEAALNAPDPLASTGPGAPTQRIQPRSSSQVDAGQSVHAEEQSAQPPTIKPD